MSKINGTLLPSTLALQFRSIRLFGQPGGRLVSKRNFASYVMGAAALVALSIAPAYAQSNSWVQAGQLTCKLNPSIGFIIFGHQSMECNFLPVSGPVQAYQGAINTVGIDLGVTGPGGLAWTVFGSAAGLQAGALAGEYVGV